MPLESVDVTYTMQDAIDGVPDPFGGVKWHCLADYLDALSLVSFNN